MSVVLTERLEALVLVAARLARADAVAEAERIATVEGVPAIGGRAGAFTAGDLVAPARPDHSGVTDAGGWQVVVVPVRAANRVAGALAAELPGDEPGSRALLVSLADLLAAALDRASLHTQTKRANEAKDVFLATVSHELRGPLAAISMWTHVLGMKSCDEPTRARAVQAIDESVRAQGRLIEDMIDLSRLRAGKLRLDLALLSVGKVAGAAVEDALPAATARGVALAFHSLGDAIVSGDSPRLRQVVANVVSNAIQFTPPGGRVDVSLSVSPDAIRVVVRDEGEGISADFLPHVFEPFHQEDDSLTRRRGGLGLGLAVAREIVGLHGGVLEVESEGRGKGATFSIELPLVGRRPVTGGRSSTSPGSDR